MAKLIILRGNSGSGKTTVAKGLQKKIGYNSMIISQDIIKREILYVKKDEKLKIEKLIFQLAKFGNKYCDIVILEGILNSKQYGKLFKKLKKEFKKEIIAFYFNIPFEETLKRHKTKSEFYEFGEKEMRKWWKEKDLITIIPEIFIEKELSQEKIIDMIYEKII